jgi:hypothetical protein
MLGVLSQVGDVHGERSRTDGLATIEYNCAPWDGVALRIHVPIQRPGTSQERVELVLWGRGLRAVQSGQKTVLIDGAQSEDGTGSLALCHDNGKCTVVVPSRLELEEADIRVDGTMKGRIVYRQMQTGPEQTVSFHGIISPSTFVCG